MFIFESVRGKLQDDLRRPERLAITTSLEFHNAMGSAITAATTKYVQGLTASLIDPQIARTPVGPNGTRGI